MQINVSQLLKSSIGAVRDYDINESIGITGDGDDSRVKGAVRLTRTDREILVKGTLNTEAE